jgi:DNA-binding IclR family transcriptional regulator
MPTAANYIVDSVDSALKLLCHVAEHPGLGVTELANRVGLNKSRAYRMLCTLEIHRLVVQEARSASYSLGPQAFVIGVAAAQQNTLVRCAQRHMLALNQALNETIVLRVRETLESVCVARCEARHDIRTVGVLGNRRPLNSGASGKVLLAFAPDDVKTEFLAQQKRLPQPPDLGKLVEELEAIARKGYAVSVGEVTRGAVAIAVPISSPGGGTVGSLSISGPQIRIGQAEIPDYLERLQACSEAISGELGYIVSEQT